MIEEVWLHPPLAFGRVGPSSIPCANFAWGENDLHPRGTGKTTLVPQETLEVADDGSVRSTLPAELIFKDEAGLRPVCPFFELHGSWRKDGQRHSGAITLEVLNAFGLSPADVAWSISVANLKPFHMTLTESDRIATTLDLRGDDTRRHALLATSPGAAAQALVVREQPLPLGSVQLTKPSADLLGLRLRFTPAAGHVYGPVNLAQRSQTFRLPQQRLILNPQSAWARFSVSDDPRANPSGLFATDEQRVSLGLVDDVCDGVIRCTIRGVTPAVARVVVGPPHYAPDRRPFVSLADGLADRVKRHEIQDPAYIADFNLTTEEVRDLLERVLETMENMNVDFQNERARIENIGIARSQGQPPEAAEERAFPRLEPVAGRPLPLSEQGRQRHRRFISLEVFEDVLRERPDLIEQWVRRPMTDERYYDRRMPALMRGSDRYPMHLTRRQYDLLVAWVRRLRSAAEVGA